MARSDGQQLMDFLSRHRPPRFPGCGVEILKLFQRISAKISALNRPVTECCQTFGVIRNGLPARPSACNSRNAASTRGKLSCTSVTISRRNCCSHQVSRSRRFRA